MYDIAIRVRDLITEALALTDQCMGARVTADEIGALDLLLDDLVVLLDRCDDPSLIADARDLERQVQAVLRRIAFNGLPLAS